jgi:predicted metal-dependent hydrolase
MRYHELYVAFLYYFNIEEDYFECHEVMEELWLEEGRDPLWQGLLQVAVALYHHSNANISGTIKLFEQAIDKLQDKPDELLGIAMKDIVDRSVAYLANVKADASTPFTPFKITILDESLAELARTFEPNHEDE